MKHVDWAHVADAKRGLPQLQKAGAGFKKDFRRWREHVAKLKSRHALAWDTESTAIQAEYVLRQLNEITKGEAIVTTGVGQHQMWAAQYIDFKHPRTFLTSGSMGTMGFGLPAAIGAQIANPGKLVIDVDGDGSIRMNLGDLETLTTYDIPVKVLLLEQPRRRHGPAVAGPLLHRAATRGPTRASTRRTSSRPPRPTASRSRSGSPR